MQSSDFGCHPSWRKDHYLDDLDNILKISQGLDRQKSEESTVKHWSNSGVHAVMTEQPMLDSPTSLFSSSTKADTLDSSPTSAMSWSSTTEPRSHTTSPTTTSEVSISPTSPNFSTPTTSPVICRACSRVFKGSQQDATSNLRRHLRTSLRHNRTGNLKCPLPECRAKASMRSDNLGPHLLKFHKMSSSPERKKIIEDSRLSAMRVDSNGKIRRRSSRG